VVPILTCILITEVTRVILKYPVAKIWRHTHRGPPRCDVIYRRLETRLGSGPEDRGRLLSFCGPWDKRSQVHKPSHLGTRRSATWRPDIWLDIWDLPPVASLSCCRPQPRPSGSEPLSRLGTRSGTVGGSALVGCRLGWLQSRGLLECALMATIF